MELQGSGWNVKLYPDINKTRNTNGRTPECKFLNNMRLLHKHSARRIEKYLASTSTYVGSPDGNLRLTTRGVV